MGVALAVLAKINPAVPARMERASVEKTGMTKAMVSIFLPYGKGVKS